jgi:pimeloyl-ACP methyl ester carboxylesterase
MPNLSSLHTWFTFQLSCLILGNPGIISYYDEFLTELHHESPSTSILGISLAGHEDYEVSSPLSLQEQVDNKVRIVDMILSSTQFSSFVNDKPKLVVAGHSVGAYMAVQVLKRRPHNVDHLFLLFPTLSYISQGSLFGKVSSALTSIPGASRIAAWIVFFLRLVFPIPLLALFVRLAHTLPGTSLSTTLAKLFNPASVRSFMHLAKYEFLNIQDLDSDTLVKYAKRITAYYADKDKWVPKFAREQVIRIISQNGGDVFICNEGFPHSFSLGILLPFERLTNSTWTANGEQNRIMDFNFIPSNYQISRNRKVRQSID